MFPWIDEREGGKLWNLLSPQKFRYFLSQENPSRETKKEKNLNEKAQLIHLWLAAELKMSFFFLSDLAALCCFVNVMCKKINAHQVIPCWISFIGFSFRFENGFNLDCNRYTIIGMNMHSLPLKCIYFSVAWEIAMCSFHVNGTANKKES